MLVSYLGHVPKVHPSAFIAPTAVLIGDVEVGEDSSVWFGTVVRGDCGPIRIGARCNLQDNAVVHVGNGHPTVIEDDVTLGHGAVAEACHIGRGVVVGNNAVVLEDVTIGEETVVGAGSVVAAHSSLPARVLAAGSPARVKKEISGDSAWWVSEAAPFYVGLGRAYRAEAGAQDE